WVKNDYPQKKTCILRTKIIDAAGRTIQQFQATSDIEPLQTHRFDQLSSVIKAPQLWSTEKPYVYKVTSEVIIGTAVVDSHTSSFGFRWFRRDKNENLLYLNGKKVILHGGNRHQEYPWLGDAIPWHISSSDILDMRNALNYNFMRMAHYPQDSRVYAMADNLGIIIDEEVPNIRNQEFSAEVQKQQLTEIIRRDRNHPSILFWSMGNETDHDVDSKYAIAEDTTRIVTAWKTRSISAGEFVINGEENLYSHLYADHGAGREYLNAPLVHVNPEGCVDMYRIPRYAYWFWQANYSAKPFVFIQPHFWSSQYLGQKKDIVIHSNCERVELKVNGVSKGTREPDPSNFNTVVFSGVTVEKGILQALATKGGQAVSSQITMAGDPRRIVLKTVQTMDADRGSVAIVTAGITDADGNPVYGATNTLRWNISGPAKLIGLPVYNSDIEKNNAMEGSGYIDAPVSNVIRSAGSPGIIKITVSSTGLTSGSAEIKALEMPADNSVVIEPPLSDSGRQPVARPVQPSSKVIASSRELKNASGDLSMIAGKDLAKSVRDHILKENPGVDTATVEFRMLTSLLAIQMLHNEGKMLADDYNFFINNYNNCRLITGYIAPLKLPQVFKDGLRKYYADAMIRNGIEKNPAPELNWMNWIPSGGTVVVSAAGKARVWPKGTIVTGKTALVDIIAEVHPQFPGFSAEARERALTFIDKMNPYVHKTEVNELNSEGEKVTNVTFSAEKEQPILIPLLKFIAE
nr:DUF4982 domain-containing protein [Bacteroidales bacterium]